MPETGEIDLLKLRAFPQISPDAFQHPDDRHATEALEKIPAFPQLIRYIYGGVFETAWRLQHLSHCIRVGPRQARTLHRHYVRAAEILSIAEIPELFIIIFSELPPSKPAGLEGSAGIPRAGSAHGTTERPSPSSC